MTVAEIIIGSALL